MTSSYFMKEKEEARIQERREYLKRFSVGFLGIEQRFVEPLKKYFASVEQICIQDSREYDMYIYDISHATEMEYFYIRKHGNSPLLVHTEKLIHLDEIYTIPKVFCMNWNPYVEKDYWEGESEKDFMMFMEAFLDSYEQKMKSKEASYFNYGDDYDGRAAKKTKQGDVWCKWKNFG